MAFHLGCRRALHEVGLLQRTDVLSCVSGGSVIGAIYVTHEGPFEMFDKKIQDTLRQGFVRSALRTAFTTREGVRAGICRLDLLRRRLTQLGPVDIHLAATTPATRCRDPDKMRCKRQFPEAYLDAFTKAM